MINLKLFRPWRKKFDPQHIDSVCIVAKRNNKINADLGVYSTTTRRVFTVLDTSAGSNVIRRDELGECLPHLVKQVPLTDICDPNNWPLEMLVTIARALRIGKFSVIVTFIFCETTAALAVLCTDYCDRYVEAICPKRKVVQLENGSAIPIVKRRLRKAFRKALLPLPA